MEDLYSELSLEVLNRKIEDTQMRLLEATSQAAVGGDSMTTDIQQLRRNLRDLRYSRDVKTGVRRPSGWKSTQVYALNDFWER